MDPLLGVFGLCAVMAALEHRRRTGEGQYIDLSQLEAPATMAGGPFLDFVLNGRLHGPESNRDPAMAPHRVYPCWGEDAWIAIAVEDEPAWEALCAVMERPDWRGDPRFGELAGRKAHEDALDAAIGAWTLAWEHRTLAARLQAAGVAAFPALSARE